MLGELHREAAARRAVETGEKPFDHAFGDDLEAAEPGHLHGDRAGRDGRRMRGAERLMPAGSVPGLAGGATWCRAVLPGDARRRASSPFAKPFSVHLSYAAPTLARRLLSHRGYARRPGGSMLVALGWMLLAGSPVPALRST